LILSWPAACGAPTQGSYDPLEAEVRLTSSSSVARRTNVVQPPSTRALVEGFATALTRAVKSAGYYDAAHPLAKQQHLELCAAAQQALKGRPELVLVAAGRRLVFGEQEPPVDDPRSAALAHLLLERSLVGVRLLPAVNVGELATLLRCLAEAPDRLRAAGGARKLLAEAGARSVEVYEVDLEAVFTGKSIDVGAQSPLVTRALQEILRLKQGGDRAGTALGITLERVGNAASLQALLDEMIEGAAPGVSSVATKPQASKSGPLAGLEARDLAHIATEAYCATHGKLAQAGAPQELLAESARVLGSALGKLAPVARFQVLAKLAMRTQGEIGRDRAVGDLSHHVPDLMLTGALAAALSDERVERDTVAQAGTLLRQLRLHERDRARLLDGVDGMLRQRGRPLDGLVYQELQAAILEQGSVLELPFRAMRGPLAEAAQRRIVQGNQPSTIAAALSSMLPRQRLLSARGLLLDVVRVENPLPDALWVAAREVLDGLSEKAPAEAEPLLAAFADRAEREGPSSTSFLRFKELLVGPRGAERVLLLAKRPGMSGPMLAELLLAAFESPMSAAARRELGAALQGVDATTLKVLRGRIADAGPAAVSVLLAHASRQGPPILAGLARQALRTRSVKTKEAVLACVAAAPSVEAMALLAAAAGLSSDEESAHVLVVDEPDPLARETMLRGLQKAAIDALGDSRSPLAVPALEELLQRTRLFGAKHFDGLRPAVAMALTRNGTDAALRALAAGRESRTKAVRDVCT
jgi:hypothetical protein